MLRPRRPGPAVAIVCSSWSRFQTGLRVSELIQLRRQDVATGPGAHLRCQGKGRKDRYTPLRRDADGKRISPHVLRHTAAMDLLQHGVDRAVIALWLGHESVETTQMYLRADMKMKEAALSRTTSFRGPRGRYRPEGELLAFLEALCLCRCGQPDRRWASAKPAADRHNRDVGMMAVIRHRHNRHTTASLLLMRGADIGAVQRILRHSDPRLTTAYGHLLPDYLRAQIDRLSFGIAPTPVNNDSQTVATVPTTFAPGAQKRGTNRKLNLVGARGFEPPASCSQSRRATRLRYAPRPRGGIVARRADTSRNWQGSRSVA